MTEAVQECKQGQEITRSMRERICDFESLLSAVPGAVFGDSELCPLTHSFAGPIYVREIRIPKGTLLTGKIHRHDHPIFLMTGDASIASEHTGVVRIQGPCHFISRAGTKRAIYAHEECVFVTIHHVGEERDLKKIEEIVIAPSFEELEKGLPCPEKSNLIDG